MDIIYDLTATFVEEMEELRAVGLEVQGRLYFPTFVFGSDLKSMWTMLGLQFRKPADEFCVWCKITKRDCEFTVQGTIY